MLCFILVDFTSVFNMYMFFTLLRFSLYSIHNLHWVLLLFWYIFLVVCITSQIPPNLAHTIKLIKIKCTIWYVFLIIFLILSCIWSDKLPRLELISSFRSLWYISFLFLFNLILGNNFMNVWESYSSIYITHYYTYHLFNGHYNLSSTHVVYFTLSISPEIFFLEVLFYLLTLLSSIQNWFHLN